AANRIEKAEMLFKILRPVLPFHRGTKPALHFLGFTPKHRGLIGDADRLQIAVRIEPGRVSSTEFFQKLRLVAAVEDVVTDVISLRERKYDEVMTFAAGGRARTGRLGLF